MALLRQPQQHIDKNEKGLKKKVCPHWLLVISWDRTFCKYSQAIYVIKTKNKGKERTVRESYRQANFRSSELMSLLRSWNLGRLPKPFA